MVAIENNNIEIVEILINYQQTDINFRDYDQQTALTIAVNLKLDKIVDLLLNNKKFDIQIAELKVVLIMHSFMQILKLLNNYLELKDLM